MVSSILTKKYEQIDSFYPRLDSHLVGRATEYDDLLGLLSATAIDGKRVCFIEGNPGTGKSYLARSLISSTEKMNGLFAFGKCDQFHLSSPYDVISQCLSNIIDQILLLEPSQIAEYKIELKKNLGFAANILVRMIPKIEPLFDGARDTEREDSFDFENTFQFAILQCIRVFSFKKTPFVIFIDDLQWVDSPSLSFLKKILEARELNNILIVVAYRSEEYKRHKELVEFKNEYSSSLVINVKDFSLDELEEYLEYCFGDVQPSKRTLAELIYKKTAGNPFFVTQFLKTLLQQKIVIKDTDINIWRWTIDSLNRIPISENAAKFIENQIRNLDEDKQNVLRFMSCYGTVCRKEVLEHYVNNNEKLEEILSSLLHKGFIIEGSESSSYRFSHDRIQQASFESLSEKDVEIIHWNIANTLLSLDVDWVDRHIVNIVNHFNKGASQAETIEHGTLILNLNLRAADSAIFSIAYADALIYSMKAIEVTERFQLNLSKDEYFQLYFKVSLCAQLDAKFDVMELYLEKIENGASDIDILKALEIRISALLVQKKYNEAYEIFRLTVSKFGYVFPKEGSQSKIVKELLLTETMISMKGIKAFKTLKPATDEKVLLIIRLIAIVFPAVYFHNADLVPIMIGKWVRIILKEGYTPETALATSSYATMLCGVMNKVDKGIELAEISKDLLEKYPNENYAKYRAYFILLNNALHLKYHWKTFYERLDQSWIRCLQFGDHEFAGFIASARVYFGYEAGEPLESLVNLFDNYNEKVKPISAAQSLDQFYRVNSRICKLRGIENKYRGEGGVDYEADYEIVDKCLEGSSPVTLYTVKMDRSMFEYFDGNYVRSFEFGAEILYENWAICSAAESNIAFFTYLAAMRVREDNIPSKNSKRFINKITKDCFKKIATYDEFRTGTNCHRHDVLKALEAVWKGKYKTANDLFELAIANVDKNSYRTDSGIIKELYARFIIKYRYIDREVEDPSEIEALVKTKSRVALLEALNAYEEWGATLLSKKLVNRYKDIILTDSQNFDIELSAKEYDRLLNSLQEITGYRRAEDLRSNLIKVIKGYISGIDIALVSHKENGDWVTHCSSDASNKVGGIDAIPQSVFHRAQNTLENFFVRDVSIEPGISKDPMIIIQGVSSFYSIALAHQGELIGLIYLASKNEILNGSKQLHILEFISRQASSTLANLVLVEDLTLSKNNFRNMYDSSKTGMLRVKEDGEVISINKTLSDWLKEGSQEEIRESKRNLWSYAWAESLELSRLMADLEVSGCKASERDITLSLDGSSIYLSASCVSNVVDGIHIFDFSFNDKTETVEREMETRNRILAEEKVKESSRFIANISHEFRTPLTIILGLAKQLISRDKNFDVETNNVLEATIRNGNRLLKLVNDLLEFTKSDTQRNETPKIVNLSNILKEICGSMKDYMEIKSSRKFNVNIQPEVFVSGFADDIAKIVFNLIQNAYKFTSEDVGEIRVRLLSNNNQAVLTVEDNGLGIPESEKEHIFDRFYQASNQASNNDNEGNGVGIGLSLVKIMVGRHNGTIRMESEEGVGTSFDIGLPLANSEIDRASVVEGFNGLIKETEMSSLDNARRKLFLDEREPIETLSVPNENKPSVLIIDDEPEIRTYFRDLLSDDYIVREAIGGNEGLRVVREEEPDLILLDIMMPKVNGIAVLRELKQVSKIKSKIIVLSAQNEQEIVLKSLGLGADDFILKTVDSIELKAKIKNLIKNKALEENLRYLNTELQLKISDINKTKAKLVHAERNDSISHIAKGVLHELNNPLNVSLQSLSFVKSVISEGMDKEAYLVADDSLNDAIQMQDRMADILKDLRDYTNNNRDSIFSKENISDVVKSAIVLNKYELSSMELHTDFEEGLVAEIKKSEIMQVITNLITNSRKAFKLSNLDRTPTIKIEASAIGNKIRVSVEDNGPGIKENVREEIFDSFYTGFEKESSGLGLNICQIILSNHDSELELVSDGKSFTKFYFDLPLIKINRDNQVDK